MPHLIDRIDPLRYGSRNDVARSWTNRITCVATLLVLQACAGPSSPFGPLSVMESEEEEDYSLVPPNDLNPRIYFEPKRQVLHGKSPLRVNLLDPQGIPLKYEIELFYNGNNVTTSFLKRAQLKQLGSHQLVLEFSDLRLLSNKSSSIVFRYRRAENSRTFGARFDPPDCRMMNSDDELRHTGAFNPPEELVKELRELARIERYNPSFLAGLVAQESGFNPQALSWAKALGLTQITPQADREIAKVHAGWPRSDQIEDANVLKLKLLLSSGALQEKDDWRLNPKLSIRGAVSYLRVIDRYWRLDANRKLLESTFPNVEQIRFELLLASYNFGPARIRRMIQTYGRDYLDTPELSQARRYINRIRSFCSHFSNKENIDENAS